MRVRAISYKAPVSLWLYLHCFQGRIFTEVLFSSYVGVDGEEKTLIISR